MIKINVVLDSKLWSKKIKNINFFFNELIKSFPRKYRFIKKNINLTLLLSHNKNIQKLNKKFLNKNKPTDVLSFPSENKINLKKNSYLGDIIISYEFMNKPKSLNIVEFKQKLIKIFIHGFLHLLGHDHISSKDYKKMLKEEKKIYGSINRENI